MSPRAACRLDTLGFEQVYDYMPGRSTSTSRRRTRGRRPERSFGGEFATRSLLDAMRKHIW